MEKIYNLSIALDVEQYNNVLRICEEKNMSVQNFIELAIDDLVFIHKKGENNE